MASSLGFDQALWLKEASSYNAQTDMTTGGIILPVRGDLKFRKTIANIKTEHLRQSSFTQNEEDDQGLIAVEGDFGGVVPASNEAWTTLLKHLTGKVTRTGTGADTDPYVRTFTWNDKIFYGLSFAQQKGGALYSYHGCQIEKCSITFKVGGPLEYRFTIAGASEVVAAEATVPTLALLAATPYYLAEHITFKIDTVTEPITEMTLDFACELLKGDDQSYAVGSNTRVALARGGVMVTGTITRRHDKDGTSGNQSKFYDKFISGATAALLVDCPHPTDGANHYLQINLGAVKFEGESPTADGKGQTMESIPFTAYDLDAATSNIIVADLLANPTAATGAYDGTGV